MDWWNLYQELEKKVAVLSERASLLQKQGVVTLQALRDAEPKERALLDTVCKQYAEDGTWPINMTQIQKVLIYIRMSHAAQFAEFLAINRGGQIFSTQQNLDSQETAVLNFLLVDYWSFAGCSRWLTT